MFEFFFFLPSAMKITEETVLVCLPAGTINQLGDLRETTLSWKTNPVLSGRLYDKKLIFTHAKQTEKQLTRVSPRAVTAKPLAPCPSLKLTSGVTRSSSVGHLLTEGGYCLRDMEHMGCKGKALCNCTRLIMGCLGQEQKI